MAEDDVAAVLTKNLGTAAILDPDSPLLARVQLALERQLQTAHANIEAKLKEHDILLKGAVKAKEDLGGRLFTLQQSLAKVYNSSAVADESLKENSKRREEVEAMVNQVRDLVKQAEGSKISKTNELDSQLTELNRLNADLRLLEQHAREAEDAAQAKERAASKATEEARERARKKMQQDLLVDRMTEELKALQDRSGQLASQAESQQSSSHSMSQLLAEATAELDAIGFQKRQRMSEWKTGLAALSRLNDAVSQQEEQVRQRQAALASAENEIAGFRQREKAEQELHERITGTLNKVKSEEAYLDKRISENEAERERVAHELSKLQHALEALEAQLPSLEKQTAQSLAHAATLQKDADRIIAQSVEVDERVLETLQSQKTHEKTAAYSENNAKKIAEQMQEKIVQGAKLQNQLAHTRVEILNSKARASQLEQTLQAAVADLHSKEELIGKYEQEIGRHLDEIERKQSEVDRLNRRLEQLLSKTQDDNTGSLDATVHNLSNEIALKQRQCAEVEGFWLRAQTELVQLNKETYELSDAIRDLSSKHMILVQKQLRLRDAYDKEVRESTAIAKTIERLMRDMERLNTLISKNVAKKSALSADNAALMSEARTQLQDLQTEMRSLEGQIDEEVADKATLSERIIELEDESQQWEKKIQLWRETQQLIDPNAGAAETVELKREVHNLETKLERLLKYKEQLIQDMETVVERRGMALVEKAIPKQVTGETARFAARRMIGDLAKQSKQLKSENLQLDEAVSAIGVEMSNVQAELTRTEQANAENDRRAAQLSKELEASAFQRQRSSMETVRYQNLVKRYSTMDIGRMDQRAVYVERELQRAESQASRAKELYSALRARYPSYGDELEAFLAEATQIASP
eukprot:m51a1_g2370 hypothetical protein (874) ;mRNA; r:651809-654719